jgi:hypothetical protein
MKGLWVFLLQVLLLEGCWKKNDVVTDAFQQQKNPFIPTTRHRSSTLITRKKSNQHPQRSIHPLQAVSWEPATTLGRLLMLNNRKQQMPQSSRKHGAEVGIEMIQILLDPTRKSILKEELSEQFPLLPPHILDMCIDTAADGVAVITPRQWKQALKPGGITEVRASIRMRVVKHMMDQPSIKNIPVMSSKDKVVSVL